MVIDRERLIVGNRPAEGADRAIVLRTAVPHQIRKAINRHPCAGLLRVVKEQLFAYFLTSPILAVAEAPRKRRLNRRGQHDGRLIAVLFHAFQQVGRKAEVALHEVLRILRAVHACQIEHEVRLLAILVQFLQRGIQIVFVDFLDMQIWASSILPIPNCFQIVAQGGSHHALRACH